LVASDFLTDAWLNAFEHACSKDAELKAVGRRARFNMALRSGDRVCLIVFDELITRSTLRITIDDSWDFTLEAPQSVWERFLQRPPARHHHDVFAMWMRVPEFRVDGDRRLFMACARTVRRLLEVARAVIAGSSARDSGSPQTATGLESIIGRYLWLSYEGRRYRVYYEEAGEGPPLLLLHTAGADSRQFMHMLNDVDFTSNWRLVAFDLPWHGRSMPPDEWWEREYKLTTDFYAGFIAAFIDGAGLDRPLVLGCSMGGEIVLELAYRYPERLRGVVGCESSANINGRLIGWTHHPEVNESEATAAWIDGLIAPGSPERNRREIWWTYSQAGAGVFNGDIDFYSREWDGRGRVGRIDTAKCPVHLLTGEYDYSCTIEQSESTAASISGARFHPMPGLGHFPIAENPPLFKKYLLPVLNEFRSGS
jgi:pimeloyl-ACP methyl ester carboxylesterase